MPNQWGSQAGTDWTGQHSPYEFYNVDQVYDYILSIGVRPVVELSFMPKALVRTCTDLLSTWLSRAVLRVLLIR